MFVQTNEAQNKVVAFARDANGGLRLHGTYETGGAGDDRPHLTSQGSVTLTGDGGHLLVTNAASGDVSLFAVAGDAGLELIGRTPVGPGPKSVTERRGAVYVLATGAPAVVGFRLTEAGLEPLPGDPYPLRPGGDPAQVGLTPDGSAVIVTERGTDSLVVLAVGDDGSLQPAGVVPSSGPTPYGFAFTSGGTLVVTEAFRAQKGAAAASSYAVDGLAVTAVSTSVGNGRSEICWAVVTPDDRYAYTTNFADGAVSRFTIAAGGALALDDAAAGVTVDGRPGLRDEALAGDGEYLYAVDADSGSVFGWSIGDGGMLTPLGAWDGLPPTVAGMSAV